MKALMYCVGQLGARCFQKYLVTIINSVLLAAAIASATAAGSMAQSIRTDGTLSTNVTGTSDGLNFTIDDGDRIGNNLFHSFENFSVPTTGSAVFTNPANITNIISRVTGNSLSNIDGLIRANGGANLFLINPAGISFGENAQLDIGGSFIGSTAESVRFSDNIEFSAGASEPLLSINRPTGVRLGPTSREIQINDNGYQVLSALPIRLDSSASLQVKPGSTLALVGNGIVSEGGAIATPGGRVELGSVQSGLVTLINQDSAPSQWTLDYNEVQAFGDIELLSQSLINTSDLLFGSSSPLPIGAGAHGGSIQLQGRQISVRDGSIGLIQNFGNNDFGSVRVSASDIVRLEGAEASQRIFSGFTTTSFGAGLGGNIHINAQQIYATGGSTVITETFGQAASGNLVIDASDNIFFDLTDTATLESGKIISVSYGTGNAGDIEVRTGQLAVENTGGISSRNIGPGNGGAVNVYATEITLIDAAGIASASLGSGSGGNVLVDADTINIIGVNLRTFFPSTIAVSTVQSGNAGNLRIETQQLHLQAGGRIDASTFATGNAGTVTINATEFLDVQGTVPGSINPSLIRAC